MQALDWVWCPSEITFKDHSFVHPPVAGKKPHEYMSPFWNFSFELPPQNLNMRREIESVLAKSGGMIPFNVYDPRVPYPKHLIGIANGQNAQTVVPALTVMAISKANKEITVQGAPGDKISIGDPIAFTLGGVRFYFKSHDTITLNGSPQTVSVYLRPRVNMAGLNVAADRIKPTLRFHININATGGHTNAISLTRFKLEGIEYGGVL